MDTNNTTTGWRKSTHSAGTGDCIEVASLAEGVVIRDSKDPAGSKLTLTPKAWQNLMHGVKAQQPHTATTI
jgi:hypothetical protein